MESGDPPRLGALVRRHRITAALSQEALAERAGLSVRAISDLERGIHRAPRLETLRLLADALALDEAGRTEVLAAAYPPSMALVDRERERSHPPSVLPVPPTRLIGRETEVATIVRRLSQEDVRLVTLTGPGGVGKTRLAVQVAANLLETFPDGVWFVDLSALDNPMMVPTAIATALGMREEANELIDRLTGALSGKQPLLVLDNFECVISAAPMISDLLARVSDLKVLATSRTPLHVYGEREYPLAPLALPDPAHLPPLAQLIQYEAVRLFIERAQSVKPDFTVTTANASAVAEICHRLDGLPLAIELAAAYIKVLPPPTLLRRLEKRLPLLTGGARDVPARQQTMRQAIAWSHDLLTAEEQIDFRRLAVFVGGCTLEAAEVVVNQEGTRDVFASIVSLVDTSLLRQEEGTDREPRFRMLETVREYALDRLAAAGEEEASWRQLASWCLALAEAAQPAQFGKNILPADAARLDAEAPNLRATVTWFLERGEGRQALRLLTATEDYWMHRHIHGADLQRWLEAALAVSPDAVATDRARAHYLLAVGYAVRGDAENALLHAERLHAAARESGEPGALGQAQLALGKAWETRDDLERSAAAYAQAIPLLRIAKLEAQVWYAQAAYADRLILLSRLKEGVPLLQEALDRLRPISTAWFAAMLVNWRAHAALLQGELRLAASLFHEAIDTGRRFQITRTLLVAVAGLAGVALRRGEEERAAQLLGATEAAREMLGIRYYNGWQHDRRIVADARAMLGDQQFKQAAATGRRLTLEEAVTEALAVASDVEAEATS